MEGVEFKMFYRETCPSCPVTKKYMKSVDMKGIFINADTDEGLAEAISLNVRSVPTVVFLKDDAELYRVTNDISKLKKFFNKI